MKPYFETKRGRLYHGDCLEVMRELEDNSIDAVVTDPPYGLRFMGKTWDYDVPAIGIWRECLRVLKPGGHLLAFAGTRTQHRMAVRIEDAGFEIRDMIAWIYGSGFPKSMNIGKAVDKLQGNERKTENVITKSPHRSGTTYGWSSGRDTGICEVSKGTSAWEGWGTALKPALEPITVARKLISEKNIAENCLKWGTGGINIDGCRVEGAPPQRPQPKLGVRERITYGFGTGTGRNGNMSCASGRFPANLIHDGSDDVTDLFPQQKSGEASGYNFEKSNQDNPSRVTTNIKSGLHFGDSGSAARFFYCAKASKSERNKGCEGLDFVRHADRNISDGAGGDNPRNKTNTPKQNYHPTVKPISLMEYLCKLVTPPDGEVLDPFAGSGTTLIACENMGFSYKGIEISEEYCGIAARRIEEASKQHALFENIE